MCGRPGTLLPLTSCLMMLACASCVSTDDTNDDASLTHHSNPATAVPAAMASKPPTFLPETHHGVWAGPNRLWVMDPDIPLRSEGTIDVDADRIEYNWSHQGQPQRGRMTISGQPAALAIDWTDTFHAPAGMTLHGLFLHDRIKTYGTYAGGSESWGWQIEIDAQDRESFFIRMYNVIPGVGPVAAVILHGKRVS